MSNVQFGITLMAIAIVPEKGSDWDSIVFFGGFVVFMIGLFHGN